jgi:hypothetical protein
MSLLSMNSDQKPLPGQQHPSQLPPQQAPNPYATQTNINSNNPPLPLISPNPYAEAPFPSTASASGSESSQYCPPPSSLPPTLPSRDDNNLSYATYNIYDTGNYVPVVEVQYTDADSDADYPDYDPPPLHLPPMLPPPSEPPQLTRASSVPTDLPPVFQPGLHDASQPQLPPSYYPPPSQHDPSFRPVSMSIPTDLPPSLPPPHSGLYHGGSDGANFRPVSMSIPTDLPPTLPPQYQPPPPSYHNNPHGDRPVSMSIPTDLPPTLPPSFSLPPNPYNATGSWDNNDSEPPPGKSL